MKYQGLDHNYIIRRIGGTSTDALRFDETIFSLSNGSIGTRGHFTEGYGIHDYPQTLMNGFYNTYPFRYEENYKQFPQVGQTIVQLPDASLIRIHTEHETIDLDHAHLNYLERILDMKKGVITRVAHYVTPQGYAFVIHERKHVALKKQLIIVELEVQSINYEGKIQLDSYLRMPVLRENPNHDPRLPEARVHLTLKNISSNHRYAMIQAETTESHLEVYAAMTHNRDLTYQMQDQQVIGTYTTILSKDHPVEITKCQAYATSIDSDNLQVSIDKMIDFVEPFDAYVNEDLNDYSQFWEQNHFEISDSDLQKALMYNTFQLNMSAASNCKTYIGAKGITGEGYEGHYFWDTEAYMLPFFIFTQPQKAKELLLYRYHTLSASRKEAMNLGVRRGAKIAWRTINGNESSPYFPAGSAQIHINSDVALAIINYYHATHDDPFMIQYGFEMLLETAIFILDYGHFKDDKFHLDDVTGPDEYSAIVNDNYYTNSMAKHHFRFTYAYWKTHETDLQKLLSSLNYTKDDLDQINQAHQEMTLLIDEKRKIIKQDASFMNKAELDLSQIPEGNFPLLLNYHPLFIYRHQVLKQADAVLSMVLLGERDLSLYQNTYDYYLRRTTHDSSLSKCIYGIAAYRLGDDQRAYQYFKDVALLDLNNLKKHTQHGLHAANLGGSYLMLMYGLFGIRIDDVLILDPCDQKQIKKAEVQFVYQGSSIHLKLEDQTISLSTDVPIKLKVYGHMVTVDQTYSFGVKRLTK